MCDVLGNDDQGHRGRGELCHVCGSHGLVIRCDYPVIRNGKPATCDRPCCRKHAVNIGPDKDLCSAHHDHDQKNGGRVAAALAARRLAL